MSKTARDNARQFKTEVAVIGSGPGGAVTSALLAEAGRDVLLLEEGPFVSMNDVAPFSLDEMVAKYRNGGVTVAMGPSKVSYVEGRCVGGGSEVNSGLYHRAPPEILESWRRDFRVDGLRDEDLVPHYESCERDVDVSYLPGPASMASLKLDEGAKHLGWRSLEVPRWFRYDSAASRAVAAPHFHRSRIAPTGTRQSMTRTFIPRALSAGARLCPETRVTKIVRSGSKWLLKGSQGLEVEAQTVFVSGGAIQTPLLLRRSGLSPIAGNSLRLHATAKIVAKFAEPINYPGMDVPVHQVKEFAPRYSLGCSISSRPHLALAMVEHPTRLLDLDRDWTRMAVYYAMIQGTGSGTIRPMPGSLDPLVRYRVSPEDLSELSLALRQLARLLFRAGAVELFPCIGGVGSLRSEAEVEKLPDPLPASRANLMTIHLSSSCPMGEDRTRAVTDSWGRVHGTDNLYIADASLLCTQPTVNPQGTIMALARRNALRYLGQL